LLNSLLYNMHKYGAIISKEYFIISDEMSSVPLDLPFSDETTAIMLK